MNKIIAIVGMCGSGKTVATELFEEAGYKKVYIGAITFEELARRGMEVNEQNENKLWQNRLKMPKNAENSGYLQGELG